MRTVYQPVDVDGQSDLPWVTDQPTNRCVDGIEPVDEADDVFSPDDSLFDDQNEVDAWTRKSDPSQDRQTTITPSERAAFEEIFKNIRKKTLNAQRYGVLDEDEAPVYVNRKEATHKLESLMGSAMKERFPTRRDEKETVINRYPPSLRALAAQAVGLDYDESHFEETAKEEAMKNDQLEELRQPVREKVESRMHAAETDAQLWAVMEDAVFPIIAKLGLEKTGKDKLLKKRGRKPAVAAQKGASKAVLPSEELQNVQFKPFFHNGQEVSPLAFYGPLYPSYLLLGLRLLDRSFARPSPLTLSILPKIKSLGLISHVLGASTQLYNELLIIHWYRYDDFRGVIKLLTEMEESGLSFNKETLDIISDITRMQGRILRGDRGATLKALWSLPEFAPGAFFSWHKKIKKMLDERERESCGSVKLLNLCPCSFGR
jgi:hypothetical protein